MILWVRNLKSHIAMYTIFCNLHRHGGWILDNFPQSREQWALMVEKNILPDDVLVLKDNSDGGKSFHQRLCSKQREWWLSPIQ